MTDSTDIAIAFAAGCDARLAGRPLTDNPHLGYFDEDSIILSRRWQSGWINVAESWGKGVRGRWLFRKLVRVVVEAKGGLSA